MEIQAEVPKIRRNRSRTHSPTVLPGHSMTRREELQGVVAIKPIRTERLEESHEREGNLSSSQSRSPKRLLKSVSFQVNKTMDSRSLSRNLPAISSMPEKPKDQTIVNVDSGRHHRRSIRHSIIIQDKTLISRQPDKANEKNEKNEDNEDLSSTKNYNSPEKGTEGPELSEKFAAEVHNLVQKRKFQKVVTSLIKIVANLDELSDEELIELAIQILMKAPSQRTINEIKVLVKCMSAVEFFRKYDQSTTESCLKHMHYISLKKGETVFESGTVGTNFWVTLKGSVSVVVNVPTIVGQDEKGENVIEKIPTEVRTLPAGSAFGELALMNSKPRAATIVCKEDCEFAVLEKGPFKEILVEKEKKNLFIQLDFLSSVPMLKSVPYHAIHWLYYNVEVTKHTRGQVISEEGQPFKGIYLIKSGEFKVLKTVNESEGAEPPVSADFEKMKVKPTVKRNIELALLGQKEIFGEDDAIKLNDQKFKYTIVCYSTQAEIYEIPKEAFEKKILCFASVRKWLVNHLEGKEAHYNQRLKIIREARSDQKPNLPYHLDRPRGSPSRCYDPVSSSIEYTKRLDNSESESNSQLKKPSEGLMKLAEKKKAILEMCCSPPKIHINLDRDSQAVKIEHNKKQNGRSKSELREKALVMIDSDQIDYRNNKISLMKLNLDRLNAKKRFLRRSDSSSKKVEGSPLKSFERQSTKKITEEQDTSQMKHDESPNSFSNAYNLILNSTIQKINASSAAKIKRLDSSLLDNSSIEESPGKRKYIGDKTIYEKIVMKRLGSSIAQNSTTKEHFKIHSQKAVFENKHAATLYNKTFGKISWNSKTSDNGSTVPLVSQSSIGSKIGEKEDTRAYLLTKFHSKTNYFSAKNDTEESPVRGEDASFYSVTHIPAQNHFKGIEIKGASSRKEVKITRRLTEGEESPLMIHSKSNYTLKDGRQKRGL